MTESRRMLLAHKIQIRPTVEQELFLRRAAGTRRHCYNQLLAHFKQDGVRWSKKAAQEKYQELKREFPWYSEVSAEFTRNTFDDLDAAFKRFFKKISGFPRFAKRGERERLSIRDGRKFKAVGRALNVEKHKETFALRERLRWAGTPKMITISERAGRWYAAILVETESHVTKCGEEGTVGIDLGVKSLATLSDGTVFPANQKLKSNLRRLKARQRNLSRKREGSARRAKAKLSVARLHKRVADQRSAALHQVSDYVTRNFRTCVIEDLNVKGMTKNRKLARAVSDAGFGELRRQTEYKSKLRGGEVIVAGRFFPSSKTCSGCGSVKEKLKLSERTFNCHDCGATIDRDLNAAINLSRLDGSRPDVKRAQELGETSSEAPAATARTNASCVLNDRG